MKVSLQKVCIKLERKNGCFMPSAQKSLYIIDANRHKLIGPFANNLKGGEEIFVLKCL